MINLLPLQQKEYLLVQKRLRLVLILEILFLSFLISLALILFWVKISIFRDLEIQKTFLEEKERMISINQELEEEIKTANLSFSNLNSFYRKEGNLTQVLEKTSGTLPSGTYLTGFGFSLAQKKEDMVQISLSGFCPDRETLLTFKRNLENENGFLEIYFPPENWAKPTDINFSVNFKLEK